MGFVSYGEDIADRNGDPVTPKPNTAEDDRKEAERRLDTILEKLLYGGPVGELQAEDLIRKMALENIVLARDVAWLDREVKRLQWRMRIPNATT